MHGGPFRLPQLPKCPHNLPPTLNCILSIRSSVMREFPSLQSEIGLDFTRTPRSGGGIFPDTLQEISLRRTTVATLSSAAKTE